MHIFSNISFPLKLSGSLYQWNTTRKQLVFLIICIFSNKKNNHLYKFMGNSGERSFSFRNSFLNNRKGIVIKHTNWGNDRNHQFTCLNNLQKLQNLSVSKFRELRSAACTGTRGYSKAHKQQRQYKTIFLKNGYQRC